MTELYLWGGFLGLVFVMLALDLGVFNRKAHVMGIREALGWTAVWIVMALAFNVGVYFIYEYDLAGISEHYHNGVSVGGKTAAFEFLAGYLVEKSLSLDNIFVISLIFSFFAVPQIYQHRVLFWGILGALVLRGLMIWGGSALIASFEWTIYVFALLLLYTALKMLFHKSENIHPDKNPVVRLARRFMPVSSTIDGEHFFTHVDGRLAMTPLFLALIVVETSDVLFAVDSIPAIFGITHDPFLVFTSNIFALLGLRSLYFALAALINAFRYLKTSLIVILLYVSAKMILGAAYADYIAENDLKDVVTLFSLGVIVVAMIGGIVASIYIPQKEDLSAAQWFEKYREEQKQAKEKREQKRLQAIANRKKRK